MLSRRWKEEHFEIDGKYPVCVTVPCNFNADNGNGPSSVASMPSKRGEDTQKKKKSRTATSPCSGDSGDLNTFDCCYILAHGAGGDMNLQQLQDLAVACVLHGKGSLIVARFTCKPISLPIRQQVYIKLFEQIRSRFTVSRFIFGGRSMGARVAVLAASSLLESHDVRGALLRRPDPKASAKMKAGRKEKRKREDDGSDGEVCGDETPTLLGVLLISYPLHPPKKEHQLRDTILYELDASVPVLFVSGTKDNMCNLTLMRSLIKKMSGPASRCRLMLVEQANHGLKLPKKAAWTESDMTKHVCRTSASFFGLLDNVVTGDDDDVTNAPKVQSPISTFFKSKSSSSSA